VPLVRKWGHTASRCTDKDAYIAWVRGGKGYGKNHGEKEANILQHDHGDEEGWKTGEIWCRHWRATPGS